jgi:hypothetical protein
MSRHTPVDFEWNQEEYIKLLKIAQGDRQQKIFAEDAGISAAYMNKALSGKYKKPFMPALLRKIADASEGRVTYKDLLIAAGYDYRKHMKYEDIVAHAAKEIRNTKYAKTPVGVIDGGKVKRKSQREIAEEAIEMSHVILRSANCWLPPSGTWENFGHNQSGRYILEGVRCSNCLRPARLKERFIKENIQKVERENFELTPYCPYCGAEMTSDKKADIPGEKHEKTNIQE